MRVIRFPGSAEADAAHRAAGERLDGLLAGELAGPEGVALRELREDVRGLGGTLSPEFERELQSRVAEWAAVDRSARRRPQRSFSERLAGLRRAIVAAPGRSLALGGGGAAVLAAVLAVLIAMGPLRSGSTAVPPVSYVTSAPALHSAKARTEALSPAHRQGPSATAGSAGSATAGSAGSASSSPSFKDEQQFGTTLGPRTKPLAPGRLQQLAASVSLGTSNGGVQQAAEAVARLGVSDGGFVEESRVQARSGGGASEAQLRLEVPSSKLASAIAALGRIAPERAVNQESEDITSAYDSAQRRLGDAEVVRRALLRALGAATSEGRIDSLREQLSSNRSQIAEYRSEVRGEAHRAATSQLEVTIAGGSSGSAHEGLTLTRGLRDAGRVLAVAGAVALIGIAALLPLGLLALVLDALRRAWRRRRRESALDA